MNEVGKDTNYRKDVHVGKHKIFFFFSKKGKKDYLCKLQN